MIVSIWFFTKFRCSSNVPFKINYFNVIFVAIQFGNLLYVFLQEIKIVCPNYFLEKKTKLGVPKFNRICIILYNSISTFAESLINIYNKKSGCRSGMRIIANWVRKIQNGKTVAMIWFWLHPSNKINILLIFYQKMKF